VNGEAVGLAHHGNGHACPDCAGWADAKRVADYLRRNREFVYRNALRLGGRKLGDGPKAPWVFKLALVDAALEAMTERATRSTSRGSEAEILPMTLNQFDAIDSLAERAPELPYCPFEAQNRPSQRRKGDP
jgi:hypothetical protein